MPRCRKPYEGVYSHWSLGLDYLGLTGGVLRSRDDGDGREGIAIVDFDGLSDLAAAALVKGWPPLRGHELRFLRSALGLAQGDLARTIGTTRATVARWEANRSHRSVDGVVPEDKPLPAWGDRAVRLYVAAAMGLSDLAGLLATRGFAARKDAARALRLHHDGTGWTLADNSFGVNGAPLAGDPRDGRRLVCTLLTGEPFGDAAQKRAVLRLEGADRVAVAALARAAAAGNGLPRWHLVDHRGKIVAHDDPEITVLAPSRADSRPDACGVAGS